MKEISITVKSYATEEDRGRVVAYYTQTEPLREINSEELPTPVIERTAHSYFPFLQACGECGGEESERRFLAYFNAETGKLLDGGLFQALDIIRLATDEERRKWDFSNLSDELMLGPITPQVNQLTANFL